MSAIEISVALPVAAFAIYLSMLLSWLHFLPPRSRTKATNGLFVAFLPLVIGAGVFFGSANAPENPLSQSLLAGVFFVVLLFLALVFYGFVDHSIRIRIAVELSQAALTQQELIAKYDPRAATLGRLEKMVDGGYLSKSGDRYSLTAKGLWFAKLSKAGKDFLRVGLGG